MNTYDPVFFDKLNAVEQRHFWFVARNRVLEAVARSLLVGDAPRVLDVGCGSGNVLRALRAARADAMVVGLDLYAEALVYARRLADVVRGDVQTLPFERVFDLAGCFDVLEHLDDDQSCARAIGKALRRQGRLIVTVPANPDLWSAFDEASCHRRRYTEAGLRQMLAGAGYQVEFLSPFFSASYPLLWLKRRIVRAAPERQAVGEELRVVPVLNEMLKLALHWEPAWLAGRRRLPFGSSLLAIARLRQ